MFCQTELIIFYEMLKYLDKMIEEEPVNRTKYILIDLVESHKSKIATRNGCCWCIRLRCIPDCCGK